jgi:hypothetical protein
MTVPPGLRWRDHLSGGTVTPTTMQDFAVDRTASTIMPLTGSSLHNSAAERPGCRGGCEPVPDAEFRLGQTKGK